MKKITCIQNYVIDKLIEDEKLSTNSLLDAVSKYILVRLMYTSKGHDKVHDLRVS